MTAPGRGLTKEDEFFEKAPTTMRAAGADICEIRNCSIITYDCPVSVIYCLYENRTGTELI